MKIHSDTLTSEQLFEIDPLAWCGSYKGRHDFNEQTNYKFAKVVA